MRFADVDIGLDDPALEDRKEIFDRVRMPERSADIFLDRVIDGAVAGEFAGDAG